MARLVGGILFTAITQFMIFLRVAESIYPGYSVSGNYISDLGVGPAAPVFNTSIILLGLAVAVSSYLIRPIFRDRLLPPLLFLAGLGAAGVGVFPEGSPYGLHTLMSFIVFFFAGVSALYASRLVSRPLNIFSAVMGVLTLAALSLFATETYLGLGPGGMERLIAYPPLIWGVAFAGYLMGLKPEK
ncbi:MAG: DUF998 domain-containing protein [Nitrososphaerota archaeon]